VKSMAFRPNLLCVVLPCVCEVGKAGAQMVTSDTLSIGLRIKFPSSLAGDLLVWNSESSDPSFLGLLLLGSVVHWVQT